MRQVLYDTLSHHLARCDNFHMASLLRVTSGYKPRYVPAMYAGLHSKGGNAIFLTLAVFLWMNTDPIFK